MTTEPPGGKPSSPGKTSEKTPAAARHVYGPRVIGAILPVVTRPSYRKHGVALGQLIADWSAIIGPALAATTMPRRLAAGTLSLGCSGPVALELQHLAGPLMDRINGALGRPVVQRLRFLQEAPRAQPPVVSPPRPAVPVAIDDFPDGPLRDALAALGSAVRSERA